MELECELKSDTKNNLFSFNNCSNYQSIINDNKSFLFNKNLTTNSKNINTSYPSCRIISSLFSKDYKETFYESNDKINKKMNTSNKKDINIKGTNKFIKSNPNQNTNLINYNIYNIKENSIFHIKIFDKYIKYYPIFNELTDYERYINYNPLIESNPHFEIITNDEIHFEFNLKHYDIPFDIFESLKEKYIKHLFTKRNINYLEEIFKYLFEEIKINISCIDFETNYEEILKNCSKLMNDINEIVEEIISVKNKIINDKAKLKISQIPYINIINEKVSNFDKINSAQTAKEKVKFCSFNNNLIKKKFILNCMNSKSMEYNFFENDQKEDKDENANSNLSKNENKNSNVEENKKNFVFKCSI